MRRVVVVAVGCALTATLAQTQADASVGARAKHFIVLDVGSNTALGVGLRAGERTDVLLEGSGRYEDDGVTLVRTASLRPAIRRYWGPIDRSVAPYLLLGLKAEWIRFESGLNIRHVTRRLGGMAGLGVDWFPAQRVSVGGHIGVEALAVRREGPVFQPPRGEVFTGQDIGTFASGVRFRLFF